jgi:hypothetical protein
LSDSGTDCLKNDRTTAALVTAELNIYFGDPYPPPLPKKKNSVRPELHKYNIHGRAAIAKPLITESNAQMHER